MIRRDLLSVTPCKPTNGWIVGKQVQEETRSPTLLLFLLSRLKCHTVPVSACWEGGREVDLRHTLPSTSRLTPVVSFHWNR